MDAQRGDHAGGGGGPFSMSISAFSGQAPILSDVLVGNGPGHSSNPDFGESLKGQPMPRQSLITFTVAKRKLQAAPYLPTFLCYYLYGNPRLRIPCSS